jgi:hypothetical protein
LRWRDDKLAIKGRREKWKPSPGRYQFSFAGAARHPALSKSGRQVSDANVDLIGNILGHFDALPSISCHLYGLLHFKMQVHVDEDDIRFPRLATRKRGSNQHFGKFCAP